MYRAVTHQIAVEVEPFYLSEQSDPGAQRFVWGYRITIANHSQRRVKLVSRHWRITDALGRTERVDGAGVVGEQPELNPGDSYQYTSGCPLSTPSGIMVGQYGMRDGEGVEFAVDIPAFSLDLPGGTSSVN